jgi:hypothetical protein
LPKTVCVGILGAGWAAEAHATAYSRLSGVEVVALWKAILILAGRSQPALLFEMAPFFFAIAATCVAMAADGLADRRRGFALAFRGFCMIAGFLAIVTELIDTVSGLALAVSMIAVVIALIPQDRSGAPTERLAWWIGVATLPVNLLGGILAIGDETLLELPLALLAVRWIWLGGLSLHRASMQFR